jgi:hypothetical protein
MKSYHNLMESPGSWCCQGLELPFTGSHEVMKNQKLPNKACTDLFYPLDNLP